MKHGESRCKECNVRKLDDGSFVMRANYEHMPDGKNGKGEIPYMSHDSKESSHKDMDEVMKQMKKHMG